MKNKSYITRIGTAVPEHKVTQDQAADFIVRATAAEPEVARKIRALYKATRIHERYSVIGEYFLGSAPELFSTSHTLDGGVSTAPRLREYRRAAAPLAVAAIRNGIPESELKSISHLITVSCTGMYAPGLDIDLVKMLGLSGNVKRTCINFMGCYAAFNALKVADSIVRAEPESCVLIVSVELCSLHFSNQLDPDSLLAGSLFGDGSAAALIEAQPRTGDNFALDAFRCELISEGSQDMAWTIENNGFAMRLSSYVPALLGGSIKRAIEKLLQDNSIRAGEIDHFAIHPGGRKILEAVEAALDIDVEKNGAARHVMRHYGNMSSATIFFVLKQLRDSVKPSDSLRSVLAMAFGPGLTVESALLGLKRAP